MRGLLNIFSLGMDQLAAQIARNGIDASVYNHSVAETVVGAILQKYRAGDRGPYILVGHSLGADAVMLMAQQLNAQGVPVALVVPFDGTESYAAPANVGCVVNLTQRKYAYVQAGLGFHGKLSNVDVSSDTTIGHVTIDKSPRLQAMALKEILQAAHGQSCRPGTNAPAVARAEQSAPKEIAPQDNGSKENAIKDSATRTARPPREARRRPRERRRAAPRRPRRPIAPPHRPRAHRRRKARRQQFELSRLFSENPAGLGPHRAGALQTGCARRLLQSTTDLVALLMNRCNHWSRGQAKADQRGFR